MSRVDISEVREFWDANPCQSDLSDEADRRKYFEEISRNRYQGSNVHIPEVADFGSFANKDVLEIGLGVGTDGFEFGKNGARYHGVDLTPASVELVQERFRLFDVPCTLKVGNAEERIPFENESFDHVYSWGVLHHSPKTEAIVKEIHRTLRPGGTFTIMLYNRSSINYHIEIMLLRRIFRLLLYPKFMPRLMSKVMGFDEGKMIGHHKRLRKGRISKEEWLSMNTDGPYCPLAKVYNRNQAAELFSAFTTLRQEVWGIDTDHWPFIRRLISERSAQKIGRYWGWHRLIYGTK